MELTHQDLLNEQHQQVADQASETIRRLIGAALLTQMIEGEV